MKKENLYDAIDERYFNGFSAVLIQEVKTNEMRMVKLLPKNEQKFNRNLQADLKTLWNLYETNPKEFATN